MPNFMSLISSYLILAIKIKSLRMFKRKSVNMIQSPHHSLEMKAIPFLITHGTMNSPHLAVDDRV